MQTDVKQVTIRIPTFHKNSKTFHNTGNLQKWKTNIWVGLYSIQRGIDRAINKVKQYKSMETPSCREIAPTKI